MFLFILLISFRYCSANLIFLAFIAFIKLLFKSNNLLNHWNMLDDFEGEGYERVIAKAKLKDESIVETYIYTLRN